MKKQYKKVLFLLVLVLYLSSFVVNAVRNVKYVSEGSVTFSTRIHYFAILRRAKWSAPIKHYDNHVSWYPLQISSDDIELNSEPTPRCKKCDKTIRYNQIEHRCTTCFNRSHIKCINKVQDQGLQHFWVCHNCVIREPSFFNVKFQELNTTSIEDIVDNYISPAHM